MEQEKSIHQKMLDLMTHNCLFEFTCSRNKWMEFNPNFCHIRVSERRGVVLRIYNFLCVLGIQLIPIRILTKRK